uniref:Uncharacterized protein n=1 Tax=Helianthus annuus TaxID=4232 RepID=A0A251UGQ0_HELAN
MGFRVYSYVYPYIFRTPRASATNHLKQLFHIPDQSFGNFFAILITIDHHQSDPC